MADTSARFDALRTAGIKANRDRVFTVTLTGKQVYDFLHLLEARSMEQKSYLDVRQAVIFCELIRDQVNEQGFAGG